MKLTSSYLTSLPFVNSDIDNSHSDPRSFTLDFHFSALDTHSPSRGLPFLDAALNASVTSVHFRPPLPCVSFSSLNSNQTYCVGRAVLDSFVSSTEVVLFQKPWRGQVGSAKSDVSPDGSSVYGFVHQRSWQLSLISGNVNRDLTAHIVAYVARGTRTNDIHPSDLYQRFL